MKKLLFVMAMLSMTIGAMAEGLTVANVTLPKNGTAEIEIGLTNPTSVYESFSLQIELPDGVVPVMASNGYPDFTLGTRFTGLTTGYLDGNIATFAHLTDGNAITGTSGKLFAAKVRVDGELEVGTVLNATISNIKFTTTGLVNEDLNNVNFSITIAEPDDGRLKFYETSATLPSYTDGETADVTMYRTIKANEWSTIVLPFRLTKPQAEAAFGSDVQLATFNGFETTINNDLVPTYIKINFAPYTMSSLKPMNGGTPYLIKTSTAIESFQADGVKLKGQINAVEKEDPEYSILTGRFTGTFTSSQIPADGLFISNNKFWYSTGDTNVKAFRAWLQLDPILDKQIQSDDSRIILNFVENEVTGINEISNRTTNKVFNLSGQQVKSPKKGLYVKDGKKVIIK